jgi:GR25 family glycosyltransferase involved in LPS biosynthesis
MRSMCAENSISLFRLRAVDGSATPTELSLRRQSSIDSISDKLISTHWDTNLNAEFDYNCARDSCAVLTNSERACAMSHLLAWLTIMDLSASNDSGIRKIGDSDREALSYHLPTLFLNECKAQYRLLGQCFHDQSCKGQGGLFNKFGTEFFLIFEDDAAIIPRDCSFFSQLLDTVIEIPSDCDICYLGYAANMKMQSKFRRCKGSYFFEPTYLWHLHAYLLSVSGVCKLLSHLPIDRPVDNFIARLIFEKKLKVC